MWLNLNELDLRSCHINITLYLAHAKSKNMSVELDRVIYLVLAFDHIVEEPRGHMAARE
jgi:hypothetical protein